MAWQERLKDAAYTSPSGVRITFDFENVSRSTVKKTAAFDFPDANGTYIQDLGTAGRRYPFRVFLWGNDYDIAAAALEDALAETGEGTLEHPVYGSVQVVPFGEIKRRDDLTTSANQAILEIAFWETTGVLYPLSQTDPSSEVIASVEEYNEGAAEQFENVTSLSSTVEQSTLAAQYDDLLATAKTGLQAVADVQQDVQQQFNAIYDSVNDGLDILIRDPLTLAFQTQLMLQSPGRALTDITARLDAYKNLANNLIGSSGATSAGGSSANANLFHAYDQFASGAVVGAVVATVNTPAQGSGAQATAGFQSRTAAILAADGLLSILETVTAWRDDNFRALSQTGDPSSSVSDIGTLLTQSTDTGALYDSLQKAVAEAAGMVVSQSFSLKQERSIVLSRDRALVELVAELYGVIDSELDFFISSNNLSGSEILSIPKGRTIVYYV